MIHLSKHITEAVALRTSGKYTSAISFDRNTTVGELIRMAEEKNYAVFEKEYMDTYHLSNVTNENTRNKRSIIKCRWWTGHPTVVFIDSVSENAYAVQYKDKNSGVESILKFSIENGDEYYEVLEGFYRKTRNEQIDEVNEWFSKCAKKWKH